MASIHHVSVEMSDLATNMAVAPFMRMLSQHVLRPKQEQDEEEDISITPLHDAAKDGDLATVKLLLSDGADIRPRTMADDQTPFHLAVRSGMIDVVEYFLKLDVTLLTDVDSIKLTPLHMAAIAGHTEIASLLVKQGANMRSKTSLWAGRLTPIEAAAREGKSEVVDVLLSHGDSLGEEIGRRQSLLQIASEQGHVDCVNLLISHGADVLRANTLGHTPLDLAIENDRRNMVISLLHTEKWVKLMTHSHYAEGVLDTPMRKLIRKMPDIAEMVFDKCVESGEKVNIYSYELLEDESLILEWLKGSCHPIDIERYTQNRFRVSKNHPLNIMVDSERDELLAHPLVTSLLHYKWNSIGRYLFYANLLLHVIFVSFFTAHALILPAPHTLLDTSEGTLKMFNHIDNCSILGETSVKPSHENFILASTVICLFLIVVKVVMELVRMCKTRLGYFTFERIPKWSLLITGVIFLVPGPCSYYKEPFQWSSGAIAVLLAWLDLTLTMRKVHKIGIYVVMFVSTLKTTLKVISALIFVIIGFAISLHMVLSNQLPFTSIWSSLLKTLILMTGEFEYDSIFNQASDGKILFYEVVTYMIFIFFVILMTILFMNLLVALAIDDIKEIQNRAQLTIKAMQVELALSVEAVLPKRFLQHMYYSGAVERVKEQDLMPEPLVNNRRLMKSQLKLEERISRLEDDSCKVLRNQEKLEEMVNNLTTNTAELQTMMRRLLFKETGGHRTESDV